MSGTIKFFHPEETFTYTIDRSFCKIVYLKKHHCLILEIESTEDIDHLEEDSLQNEFPKIVLNIDDFPIDFQDKKQLVGKTIQIPYGTDEVEDEDGEMEEIYYTNLLVNEEDLEMNSNVLKFTQNKNGVLKVHWTGKVVDFTDVTDDNLSFEVECQFVNKKIIVED